MSAFFNPVIASITVRATLGRRRALLFAIPAVVLIALTLAVRATHPAGSSWEAQILGDFGFSVLLPLLALIIGTGVLGAEIDDGSAIHLLATPVRRGSIVLTKWVVAAVLTTRAIAAGLLYVLIWEGLLGNIVGGARILSIAHYSLGIANAIYPDKDLNAGLGLSTSLVLGIVVTVGALVLASRRLSSFAIKGEPA